jgi:hypothetical protein
LGFQVQIEEFLENLVPTRYQIMANSDTYISMLSIDLLILAVPVGFYVVIRLHGLRESRREKVEREKQCGRKPEPISASLQRTHEKILNPPFFKGGFNKELMSVQLS